MGNSGSNETETEPQPEPTRCHYSIRCVNKSVIVIVWVICTSTLLCSSWGTDPCRVYYIDDNECPCPMENHRSFLTDKVYKS